MKHIDCSSRLTTKALQFQSRNGSVAIMAIVTVVVISLTAAGVLAVVLPGYHVSVQTAGWQEARLASEAGVDLAIARLNASAINPAAASSNWTDWKNSANVNASGTTLGRVYATASSPNAGLAGHALLKVSPSLFLDNHLISGNNGLAAVVDVEVCALYPDTLSNNTWFRIRSMGTAALGGPARTTLDKMDTTLRRLSLREARDLISESDVLTPITAEVVPYPRASRIAEVIVRPVHPFTLAIHTDANVQLGNSIGWTLDSYDSRDPSKSAPGSADGGVYDPAEAQRGGNLGTNKENVRNDPAMAQVDANAATVLGNVMTNGGDDSATNAYENVSGAERVSGTITDEFYDPLVVVTPPTAAVLPTTSQVPLDNNYVATDTGAVYRLTGALTDPLIVSGTGEIVIIIPGDLDIGSGVGAKVVIPPGVKATIYVGGDIDFNNGTVNSDHASSKVPGNLIIYGYAPISADGVRPRLDGSGNPTMIAAFFGPNYNVELSGTNTWLGAIVANKFQINGGGTGGFHYDEALSKIGVVRKYEIVNYFEDSRK